MTARLRPQLIRLAETVWLKRSEVRSEAGCVPCERAAVVRDPSLIFCASLSGTSSRLLIYTEVYYCD